MNKKYLADLIGDGYKTWGNKKVFITAPTGMGKTTFVLEKLIPFHAATKRKILVLCNRKLLRKQYFYDMARKFLNYTEMTECIEIQTYQQLAEFVKDGSYREFLNEFSVICCDECHYFYADSDFNGFGTYVLLHVLIQECIWKQMIFMTATMEEVSPLIEEVINNCILKVRIESQYEERCDGFKDILRYDFSHLVDYSRVNCIYAPDLQTLCGELVKSSKKAVVFVDDKSMAEEMQQKFWSMNLRKKDVVIFNAENLEDGENSRVVEYLVMCNKLQPQVLITTSVLDNGVSIQDADVGNVVIITESRISFLQMLGRVRAESTEYLNLYFLERTAEIFAKRERRLLQVMEKFEEVEKSNFDAKRLEYMHIIWDGSNKEMADMYRKIFVLGRYEYNLPFEHTGRAYAQYGKECLRINYFAKEKMGANYLAEARFHASAMLEPVNVAVDQIKWIGKSQEELGVITSSYRETQISALREELLEICDYSLSELMKRKELLAKKYRKDIFSDVVSKTGSFSKEKLCKILERYGLELCETVSKNGTKRYSVVEKEEE